MRQQLQHLVVLGQHGGAPVQQGAQLLQLAIVVAAAAQLPLQGLQLLVLACDDGTARIFTAHIVQCHQHLVLALCICRAGGELYAPVALGTKVVVPGVVVFLSLAFACGGKALAVGLPGGSTQQGLQRLAGGAAWRYIKPLAPRGRGHEQMTFCSPERIALAGLAQQFDELVKRRAGRGRQG